ncbi:MAG: phosphoribosylaminoimidazole carboxylase, PurE protein [halophilic archaeon J07HX5]|jgi:phosphoribosylaminoimidazole carboxylase, PurE protein|nr:MAG: phosphoribosylaminoimidazole carboxylase, PurE protein [halophilic archaeon J07HX5]
MTTDDTNATDDDTNPVASLIEEFRAETDQDRPPEATPEIGVVMGSDSDLEAMAGAHKALSRLGFAETTDRDKPPAKRFSFESYVLSAHRTPDLMYAYAETAADRGLEVVIAGAGGKAADLPNMVASIAYPLPVIGVPIQEKSVDSVVGMPTGAPLLAVDAGKSYNAALSAAQILAREHQVLRQRLTALRANRRSEVAAVSRALHEQGTPAVRDGSDPA